MDEGRVIEVLAQTGIVLADQMLRTSGGLPPPTVHLLTKFLADPYLGGVATRPYRRGEDAAATVAELGRLPAIARATRLLVIWEYEDLLVSVLDPHRAGCPNGVVVLDCQLDSHVVHWHPARFRLPGEHSDPAAVIVPEWGEPASHADGWLPEPVQRLLDTWRQFTGGDVAAELARLDDAGFEVSWRSERDGVGQPVRR